MHKHEFGANGAEVKEMPKVREGVLVLVDETSDGAPAIRLTLGGRLLRVDGSGAKEVPNLLRLLDGSRTVDDLFAELDGVSRDEILSAIAILRRHALLEPPVDPAADEAEAATAREFAEVIRAFHDVGIHGGSVVKAVRSGHVAVVGRGVLAELSATALRRVGVGTVENASPGTGDSRKAWMDALEQAHIAVVALDVDDPSFLSAFNKEAINLERPWLMVRTSGMKLRLGPLFLPRQTACYACYERRLAGNATYFSDIRAVREAIMSGRAAVQAADNVMPALAALAADMAAFEMLKFFGSWVAPMALQPSLYGRFIDYAMLELEGTSHRVLKLPRCQTCGIRASGKPTTRAWMEPYDYRKSD